MDVNIYFKRVNILKPNENYNIEEIIHINTNYILLTNHFNNNQSIFIPINTEYFLCLIIY